MCFLTYDMKDISMIKLSEMVTNYKNNFFLRYLLWSMSHVSDIVALVFFSLQNVEMELLRPKGTSCEKKISSIPRQMVPLTIASEKRDTIPFLYLLRYKWRTTADIY
jgi:tellurite resistance protein TehA-like permease